jgi:hypothetical protein
VDNLPTKTKLAGDRLSLTAVQRKINNSVNAVTVMLSNETQIAYFFQPQITITIDAECRTVFVPKNDLVSSVSSIDEDASLQMLYRKRLSYATGHGVAAVWDIDHCGLGIIKTEHIPVSEVPRVRFELRRNTPKEKSVDNECLSMKYLSDLDTTPRADKISKMVAFIDTFGDWVDSLQSDAVAIGDKFYDAAQRHITACRESYERMKNGLTLLLQNDTAWESFCLANRAMFMQRIHGDFQKTERDIFPDDANLQEKLAKLNYAKAAGKHYWRPFQLAFLLMSVRSIVDSESKERDLVDLIWFPTGGGKTEAYLGLTAFTIFNRRLSKIDGSGGTAVFMRYTLRLLTSQQFTRAATLICACESMRKKEPKLGLGDDEITIGLWIGGEHIPNKRDKAKEFLSKLTATKEGSLDYRKDRYNKFQVLKCPWCGTKLTKEMDGDKEKGGWGYIATPKEFKIHCLQEGCSFESKLPIKIIDDDIYEKPPTLLFATVDKFAMLPWKSETGALFGLNGNSNRAPELIIQDELHLISGPLGSIVGIYETAIDWLTSFNGTKPKIIASTATIRRAGEQVGALYNRQVRQFPAPGIDASDSFFATEETLFDQNGNRLSNGRLYCGIMPSGITKAMMQARLFAVTLQSVNRMNLVDEVKDLLWTETGYYNSLRDLGKASALIDDDVKDFIKRLAYRHSIHFYTPPRSIPKTYELTSRVPTTELLDTLDKIEHLKHSKENMEAKKYAVSTLLASNMISVGVDIDRLNIMLIIGQPKLTSEYIQASSRIGRSFPGVAFTLYDAAKSRDRSYYEMFVPFHESFYKYVEPTGITPFSIPARNKALHAVIVSALRHTGHDLSGEKSAANIDAETEHKAIIEKLKSFIKERVKDINALNPVITDDSDAVEQEVQEFIDEWQNQAQVFSTGYQYGFRFIVQPPMGSEMRLIKPFHQGGTLAKETLTSMRSVDESVKCGIIVWKKKESD